MRVRTVRAVEPNAGVKAELQKRLQRSSKKMLAECANRIFEALENEGLLERVEPVAQDAAVTFTLSEKTLRKRPAWRVRRGINPRNFRRRLDRIASEEIARSLIHAGEDARRISTWFCRSVATAVSSSQRRALTDAGLTLGKIRERWTVPVIRGQYLSPKAAENLPTMVSDFTELITKMGSSDLERLQAVIVDGMTNGYDSERVRETLRGISGFSEARAKRVALDQSNKIGQAIQRANAESLGITEAVWVHVPGKYTSRETHMAMNGKRFKLKEGLYDPDVGEYVVPAQLPFCRCMGRSILPKELFE